jgi:hypothetical protein
MFQHGFKVTPKRLKDKTAETVARLFPMQMAFLLHALRHAARTHPTRMPVTKTQVSMAKLKGSPA